MERAENFKKVLDVFFGGAPPQVGSSTGTDTDTDVDTSTGSGSSSSGSSSGTGTSEKWYPDYNPQFALGVCKNEAPSPNGRPSYDTGVECCEKAYAGQASGACRKSLPQGPANGNGDGNGSTDSGSSPVAPRPTRQPVSPTSEAGMIISSETFMEVENALESVKGEIDDNLFLYQTPAFQWIASSVYRYDDFKESLHVMATEGVAGKKFYIGESDVTNGHVYGLVNIAAFLAQSMKETIQYDACDENRYVQFKIYDIICNLHCFFMHNISMSLH